MDEPFERSQQPWTKKRRKRRCRVKKVLVVPPSWRPLSQRLSPNRSCFDADLKSQWEGMSKVEKKELLKEDRRMLKAWKLQRNKPEVAKAQMEYPFEVKREDHCETPLKALQDVQCLLAMIATATGKTPQNLKIYDPYYCTGKVKERMAELGYQTVFNEKIDFYRSIEEKSVPSYDVLVTHPPLSGDHMKRLLEFCVQTGKPFCILLPADARKAEYYVSAVGNQRKSRPMYVCPRNRYEFLRPGVGRRRKRGKDVAKQEAVTVIWYVSLSPLLKKAEVLKQWRLQEQNAQEDCDVRLCNSLKELPKTGWEGATT